MSGSPAGRRSAIFVACVLFFAGCNGGEGASSGDNAPSTESAATPESSQPEVSFTAFCDAAEEIADLDDESQGLLNDLVSAAINVRRDERDPKKAFKEFIVEFREFAISQKQGMIDAYERLAADAPSHLRDDVTRVKELSLTLYEILLDVESIEDLRGIEGELRRLSARDAVESLYRLDDFSRSQCDVTLAD